MKMNKKDAIMWLNTLKNWDSLMPQAQAACAMGIEALEKQDDNDWVPAESDTLPEESIDVWITVEWKNKIQVFHAVFNHTNNRFHWKTREFSLNEIIAWRPYIIPQPYQKGE